MKKSLLLSVLSLSLVLSGCGTLLPKPVELFQKKVQKMPEATDTQRELQREAAKLAKDKASQVVDAALSEGSSTNIVAPARDAEKLTDAVSTSLGPPLKPAKVPAPVLADKLNSAVAKLDVKVEKFAAVNDSEAGKKIEGTGLMQIPYFLWIGCIALVGFIAYHLIKGLAGVSAAAGQPEGIAALGVLNVASSVAAKGFAQMVKGGENFKNWVTKEVTDPALQSKILGAFRTYHTGAQDQDVQATIKQLTTHQ
jgi:hypothetical protein